MFLATIKGSFHATLHCIARSTGTWEGGTFTTQGKRYIKESKPYSRAFTTIGKQTTNHAK